MAKSRYQFCSSCGGLLLPKEHKKYLQCIVCGKKQEIPDQKVISVYSNKSLKTSEKEIKEKLRARKTAIVEDGPERTVSITEDEREAMEDLFLKE